MSIESGSVASSPKFNSVDTYYQPNDTRRFDPIGLDPIIQFSAYLSDLTASEPIARRLTALNTDLFNNQQAFDSSNFSSQILTLKSLIEDPNADNELVTKTLNALVPVDFKTNHENLQERIDAAMDIIMDIPVTACDYDEGTLSIKYRVGESSHWQTETVTDTQKTELSKALDQGNCSKILSIVGAKPYLLAVRDLSGFSPLHVILKDAITQYLLSDMLKKCVECIDKSAEVLNLTDKEGCTPLHLALRLYNDDACVSLINAGVDHSKVDNRGFNCLHYAIHTNNKKVFDLLIPKDVKVRGFAYSLLPVSETFNRLTGCSDPNYFDRETKDTEKLTPLLLACKLGRFDMAKRLVGYETVRVDATSSQGLSAVDLAKNSGMGRSRCAELEKLTK